MFFEVKQLLDGWWSGMTQTLLRSLFNTRNVSDICRAFSEWCSIKHPHSAVEQLYEMVKRNVTVAPTHIIYSQLLYEFMLSRIKVDQNATSFLCLESSCRHHFVNNNWESHNPQHPYIVSLSMFYPCYCHFRSTQKNGITIFTQKFQKQITKSTLR